MASCSPTAKAKAPRSKAREELDVEKLALLAKALGHPARITLLKHLAEHETCFFGDLTTIVPLAASTISQHVTVLKEAGLICGSADEQRVCYCVNMERLAELKRMIASL